MLQVIGHSVAGSRAAQLPGFLPSALLITTYSQQVASFGRVLPLCRGVVGVFYSPSRLDDLESVTSSMNATINSATGVSSHYVIAVRHPNIDLRKQPRNEPTNQSPTTYDMQINVLLRQVHQPVALAKSKADHKLNTKLNQLLYKDPIQVGDKVLLYQPQSTTVHSSQLDWIGPFEVVKTNEMVIQVRNEKGETDWTRRAHTRRLELQPKQLSHNCLPTPTTSRSPTRS